MNSNERWEELVSMHVRRRRSSTADSTGRCVAPGALRPAQLRLQVGHEGGTTGGPHCFCL